MRQSTIARRYAAALLNAAVSANAVDAVEGDLELISQLLTNVPDLYDTLTHPLIPPASKKTIMKDLLSGRVQPITLDFIHLLSDKRRDAILADVHTEYARMADEHRGYLPVTVTSAVALAPAELERLRDRLNEYLGKRVDIQVVQDPSLIGGLMVRIRDTVMDGTVKGFLDALRARLLASE